MSLSRISLASARKRAVHSLASHCQILTELTTFTVHSLYYSHVSVAIMTFVLNRCIWMVRLKPFHGHKLNSFYPCPFTRISVSPSSPPGQTSTILWRKELKFQCAIMLLYILSIHVRITLDTTQQSKPSSLKTWVETTCRCEKPSPDKLSAGPIKRLTTSVCTIPLD